eukprot:5583251-Amphidinium_carterae.1
MRKFVTFLNPLLGSAPAKLFVEISKLLTTCIARMPPSGSAPAKWLLKMRKSVISVTASIACMPPSGSAPAKRLV